MSDEKAPLLIPVNVQFDQHQECNICGKQVTKDGFLMVYDYDFFCDSNCALTLPKERTGYECDRMSYCKGFMDGVAHRKKFTKVSDAADEEK
jgi:hypothetical protein